MRRKPPLDPPGRVKPKGDICEEAIKAGAKGIAYIRVKAGGETDAPKPLKEGLTHEQMSALLAATGAQEGDLLLLAAGDKGTVNKALDRVRQYCAQVTCWAAPFRCCCWARCCCCPLIRQRRLCEGCTDGPIRLLLSGRVPQDLGLVDASRHNLLWVVDFPMFELDPEEGRLVALHHPFTAPNPEDMGDLPRARALAYDMVYNGVEIGGGSLRNYR